MNFNSNANNNNVERQRRKTEKKSESDSRTTRTEHIGKKDQNKSQKIVILGGSMIKNIKWWEIAKKPCIMQMFMLGISWEPRYLA